jgi:hypothetical protein
MSSLKFENEPGGCGQELWYLSGAIGDLPQKMVTPTWQAPDRGWGFGLEKSSFLEDGTAKRVTAVVGRGDKGRNASTSRRAGWLVTSPLRCHPR